MTQQIVDDIFSSFESMQRRLTWLFANNKISPLSKIKAEAEIANIREGINHLLACEEASFIELCQCQQVVMHQTDKIKKYDDIFNLCGIEEEKSLFLRLDPRVLLFLKNKIVNTKPKSILLSISMAELEKLHNVLIMNIEDGYDAVNTYMIAQNLHNKEHINNLRKIYPELSKLFDMCDNKQMNYDNVAIRKLVEDIYYSQEYIETLGA